MKHKHGQQSIHCAENMLRRLKDANQKDDPDNELKQSGNVVEIRKSSSVDASTTSLKKKSNDEKTVRHVTQENTAGAKADADNSDSTRN